MKPKNKNLFEVIFTSKLRCDFGRRIRIRSGETVDSGITLWQIQFGRAQKKLPKEFLSREWSF
jgi:hypothetical protein